MALGASGCPSLLDDDFTTAARATAGAPSVGGRGAEAGAANGGEPGGGPEGGAGKAGGTNGGDASGATSGGDSGMAGDGDGGNSGAAGAGGAEEPVVPCATCLPSECCEGQCVDLRFDAQNCRSCGTRCPGTTCDNSSCTNTCAFGFLDCNQNVVDGCEVNPAVDPQNCGNCTIECGFQVGCVDGKCVCPPDTADCDGLKVNGCEADTSSNAASCGGCGKACSEHQSCSAGVCACATGFADCNQLLADGCEAELTADDTCGSCNLDCGLHGKCIAPGQCGCASGYLDCDGAATPGCEIATTDPTHCGACEVSCPVSAPACDGTDCSLGCGGLTACGASCVDTKQDPQNCGGCAKPVGLNQVCVASKPVCVTGYANCDADPNDCEVDTLTDAAHCGACPTVCKSGAVCSDGSCACAPTTPNDCGAACQTCCNDSQCSDGDSCTADTCSNGACMAGPSCAAGGTCCAGTGCFDCCSDAECGTGQVCSGNVCLDLVCTFPQILCDSKCITPTTDAANCGGCGNDCGNGRTCAAAACTPKWVATSAAPAAFVAREKAAYTAMGSKVFIWGGSNATPTDLGDGAVYDPASNAWDTVGTVGAPPTPRVLATAVWTGSVVVVWGGGNVAGTTDLTSGSRYDPLTKTWQAITTLAAPLGRRGAYGFWTGSRVLFYGGVDRGGVPTSTLSLYDPVNDVWSATSSNNRPSARTHPNVGFSGSLLIVYGGLVPGFGASDRTYAFDLASNTWEEVDSGPARRYGAFGTWDGSFQVAWSGTDTALRSDGQLYQPTTDNWSNMATVGRPTNRWAPHRETGWSARSKPGVTLMVGGLGATANTFFTDGGIYNSTSNTWSAIPSWPSGSSHLWGVGVWTGTELVIWGGRAATASLLTATGERYRP